MASETRFQELDPHVALGSSAQRVLYQVFETLVEQGPIPAGSLSPALGPGLASRWEVADGGRTFTFHLRPGVRFHDGTPLDAAAVLANIRRVTDPASPLYDAAAAQVLYHLWRGLQAADPVGPLAVRLRFDRPFYELPQVLAQWSHGAFAIVSPAQLARPSELLPAGTGPYRFAEQVPGGQLVLERNPDYRGAPAGPRRVVVLPMPEAGARVGALLSGEADLAFAPPGDASDGLAVEGVRSLPTAAPQTWLLALNPAAPELADPRVRRAISLAIDRSALAREVLGPAAQPASSLLPAVAPGPAPLSYDPSRARELLELAGYSDGLALVAQAAVDGPGQALPVRVMQRIQADLARIGVVLQVRTYPWDAYAQAMRAPPPAVALSQAVLTLDNPYPLHLLLASDLRPPRGLNVGGYANPQVDKLLADASAEPDPARRESLYRRADELAVADAWYIPLCQDRPLVLFGARLRGLPPAAFRFADLRRLSLASD